MMLTVARLQQSRIEGGSPVASCPVLAADMKVGLSSFPRRAHNASMQSIVSPEKKTRRSLAGWRRGWAQTPSSTHK
jgi:hypothetical protein